MNLSKPTVHRFHVIIEQDHAGWYLAECPALKSCYAQGNTYEETVKNITDAMTKCLQELKAKRQPVPDQLEIISIRWIEVTL